MGETDRPRFPPVYSAILGAGYSRLHFSAPSSLAPRPVLLNATAYLFLIGHFYVLPALFALCLYRLTVSKVTLNATDTFRQLLRYRMLFSSRGSHCLTRLSKAVV